MEFNMAKKTLTKSRIKSPQSPKIESGEGYYKNKLKTRFWMVVHYLSLPLTSALVFGFAALCEFTLFNLLWSLMEKDIQELSIVRNISELVQIAIAVFSLVGFLIHAGFSLYGQYQIEKQFLKDED